MLHRSMEAELRWIAEVMGAREVRRGERIQSLWGGYGELLRVRLVGVEATTAVLKWVKPPAPAPPRSARSPWRRGAWFRSCCA